MQDVGFTTAQITSHLTRLTRRKLVETEERKLTESIDGAPPSTVPKLFRTTTSGAYHVKKWCGEFSYLEAVAFDTPIFDSKVRDGLAAEINNHRLSARFHRAELFAQYLDDTWKSMPSNNFFDWNIVRSGGSYSFVKVQQYLRDHNL